MRTRSKVLLTAAAAGALVVGGAGTAYAAHYQDRALPGSSLSGVSVAGMTRAEVADAVRQRAADVTVVVDTGASSRTVHLDELGYAVDVDATVAAVFAANDRWSSYATSLLSSRDLDAVVTADAAATAEVVTDIVSETGKAAKDATVVLAKDKRSFVVTPAVTGQTVTRESFHDVVEAATRDLAPATATLEFVDTAPEVSTEDAEEVAAQANALVARTVAVDGDEDEYKASAKTKASWVQVRTADGSLGTPTLDAAKVRRWVEKVAKEDRSDPVDGVRNVSTSGKVLAVVRQAEDGAVVANAPAVATAVTAALAAGKNYAGDFEITRTPAKWTERKVAPGAENLAYPATVGEKWIDVNLSRHTMTAYVGGKRVMGPVAMVNGGTQTPTVTGTFHVYLKYASQTMRGANADGSRYETEDVPYISYFHRGYALHGAPWRSSFGYAGARGSHGCVNLPVSTARWVYDWAPVGTPVTSHY